VPIRFEHEVASDDDTHCVAHPFDLVADNAGHPLRYVGNGSNILASLNAMVCIAIHILGL